MPPDELAAAITRTAALNSRNPRLIVVLVVFVALTVVGATVLFVLFLGQRSTTADLSGRVQSLSGQVTRQHDDAETLARQVKALGAAPVVQPQPVQGAQGPAGPAGRGIVGTAIEAGHLILRFSDGSSADVGQITGQPGSSGLPGTSVTTALIVGGHLVLTYSDGHTTDAGQVVGAPGQDGAPGRSVTSVTNTDGHLIVTFSDGLMQDAGPLPAGPAGPTGPTGAAGKDGKPPAGFTFTDELGQSYTCTPDTAPDPGADPHYSCSATSTTGSKH